MVVIVGLQGWMREGVIVLLQVEGIVDFCEPLRDNMYS